MTADQRRVLVLFHSRTGTSARLARDAARLLARMGHEAALARLAPRFSLPYPAWLLLSFLPGMRIPLSAKRPPDPSAFDALLLAFPKWTFGDPVVNRFLADAPRQTPTAFLVTCGGWDAERYARRYAGRWRGRGGNLLGFETFPRREVGTQPGEAKLAMCLRRWF